MTESRKAVARHQHNIARTDYRYPHASLPVPKLAVSPLPMPKPFAGVEPRASAIASALLIATVHCTERPHRDNGWQYRHISIVEKGYMRTEEPTSDFQSLMRICYADICMKK